MAFGRIRPKSVLFFTQHKSASVLVTRLLMHLGHSAPLKHVNYGNLLSDLGCFFSFGKRFPNEHEWYYQHGRMLFQRTGCVYGPFRYPIFIHDWELFKKIIFLRDPRDALISRYYSFGFSHGVPEDSETQKWFLDERKKIQTETIDEYCLRMASEWSKPMLSGYVKMVKHSMEKPLVITYEKYVESPRLMIGQIFDYCGVKLSEDAMDLLAHQASPVSKSIRLMSHKRSGRTGQYLEELRPETVVAIEEILGEELEFFCWDRPAKDLSAK